jgi:CPA2 family monovalent cation:H+ antiporter-2
MALMWRNLIRVYSKAQIALEETFAQPPPERNDDAVLLAGLLKDVHIETVTITGDAPAKGRLIRELALRTKTGASIAVIERAGARLVNPGPDEELQSADQILLLGTRPQLERARHHLLDKN